MATPDTLRFDVLDHVMLIVHANLAPDAEQWSRMMLVRGSPTSGVRDCLVVAPPRASLSVAQRADVVRLSKRGSIAVLTESALVRGVSAAVGLLGVKVRAFDPRDLEKALTYLELPPRRHADAERRLTLLKSQLEISGRGAVSA